MIDKINCPVCDKLYSKKGIYTHISRAHGDAETRAKYSSGHNGSYHKKEYKEKISAASTAQVEAKHGKKVALECACEHCKVEFVRTDYLHKKDQYRFCSRSCASVRNHSDETKQKISKSIQIRFPKKTNSCKRCGTEIAKNKYCNDYCRDEFKHSKIEAKKSYRLKSSFRFNLADYPEEFDFDLVKEHGWYKARNRGGDGKSGVSRDHIYSVMEGYKNSVDPKLLRHPANCRLILQVDNVKKYTDSSISLEELNKKIALFDAKYGKFED